ncbi:hypothetical protein K488DRAFT_80619 [Vararia minispora EC-137]|uniref:Uncharacterized protein n=1 Tax=Vararia minispora EC-137 TaxID=1314806 RepID=A0ACB8QAD6_9AGAM|nr:hypothetical protein K488DRAFT_80619 [Vararia minispora EC-137]
MSLARPLALLVHKSPSKAFARFPLIQPEIQAPFASARRLFDYLRADPAAASALNATYPKRGIIKTAATHNASTDQKFTIDLSPARTDLIPSALRGTLGAQGLDDVLGFFSGAVTLYVDPLLRALSALAGADFAPAHAARNLNFRLCDYHPATAAPASANGCGAHTDYGTFSVIFQDGTPGLEMEAADGSWVPVPGDATVVLTGWCAVVLSGGRIAAARHRVRRTPGVRRLSAVLFAAPDLDVALRPLTGVVPARRFSDTVMRGEIDVRWFKETMGKTWRKREGNEPGGVRVSQDSEIEKLIWG